LQIEDGLVHSWGEAHHAISGALLDTLKNERQEMRKLMDALRAYARDALGIQIFGIKNHT
jgi:hypothetical protein